MARGDVTIFEDFADQLGKGIHNFSSDVLKLGLIDDTAAPTAGDVAPDWSDYVGNQVSDAGGYVDDGLTLAGVGWSETGGVGTLVADNVALAQNGAGFDDAYWGIIYNATAAGDNAIGFVDLGGPVSEQDGPVQINWNASGILTITVS